MVEKISRFKFDAAFQPYLVKVLNRLPADVKEKILNDKTLQLISSRSVIEIAGIYFYFDEPISHLVYLNGNILKTPEYNIIHTIAHELAHYIVGRGQTGLYEKEAEDLLIKWGFEEESKKVDYQTPFLESSGYEIGYKWALEQKDNELLSNFGEFYEPWDNGTLSAEQLQDLLYVTDVASILSPNFEPTSTDESMEQMSEPDAIIDFDLSADKGVIWGIMARVKEIKMNK
jgi:hypothetical protein